MVQGQVPEGSKWVSPSPNELSSRVSGGRQWLRSPALTRPRSVPALPRAVDHDGTVTAPRGGRPTRPGSPPGKQGLGVYPCLVSARPPPPGDHHPTHGNSARDCDGALGPRCSAGRGHPHGPMMGLAACNLARREALRGETSARFGLLRRASSLWRALVLLESLTPSHVTPCYGFLSDLGGHSPSPSVIT